LQEWFGVKGCVVVKGVCGETTQDMRLRFQEDVLAYSPQVAILLGGTNDLGCSISSEEILENLRFFYEQAQARGILPVAVTVPSLRDEFEQDQDFSSVQVTTAIVERAIALRVLLNQGIKQLGQDRHFPVVDWFAETCDPKTQTLAFEYSNDGLHLNVLGYRKLAKLIWTQVLEGLLKDLE
jgi:lysophospholipase L1-like esterase